MTSFANISIGYLIRLLVFQIDYRLSTITKKFRLNSKEI